jgi:hypothetical protein
VKRKRPVEKKDPVQKNRYVYKCTTCGEMPIPGNNIASRDMLLQKKVMFADMGTYGKVRRTRTVGWLCPKCLLEDPDYNAKKYPDRPEIREITDPDEYMLMTQPRPYAQGVDLDADESYRPSGY